MGKDVKILTRYHKQVSLDIKGNLILLSDNAGSLVRLELDGTIRDTTRIGTFIDAVAYIAKEDLYILSDSDNSNYHVLLVCPDTLAVVRSLGDKGTFNNPDNICVGDINGSTTIVIIDCGNSAIYMYSISGELIRTYGPQIGTLGSLCRPWGVSIDRTGHIGVCDRVNGRVLRVWSDKDGDHWECLLDKAQLGGQPWCIDIDSDNRLMVVSVGNILKLYTF